VASPEYVPGGGTGVMVALGGPTEQDSMTLQDQASMIAFWPLSAEGLHTQQHSTANRSTQQMSLSNSRKAQHRGP
jgi:hypothetical protein